MGEPRRWSLGGVWPATLVVTALAVIDVSAGPSVVLAGVMTVGPCLAAIAVGPRLVLAVGAYSIGLLALLSGPDRLWGTTEQLLFLLALLAVTAVSAAGAARRERDEHTLRAAEVASARASAASAATSEFLSRVSHELRTPLNAVLGFTELLTRDELTPRQQEATGQVMRAGQHLLQLVDDVLDVTAIESARLTLSVEPVRVGDVVRAAVDLTTPQARQSNITLAVELDEAENWHVAADMRRLRQILVNLLSNGVKFNRPAGSVTVSATRDGEDSVTIAVSDTGPGIAPQDQPKLFAPFERLGADRAGIEGSGMGLAVSRGLAEAMAGSLVLTASDATGATFLLTLQETAAPAVGETPEPGPQTTGPARAIPAASLRVLCVEDNPSNLRLVARIVERRPEWTLTHAATGPIGIELALATRFDLILLDQNLPGMEGLAILRALRERDDRADVPVVIVSADASPGQLQRARDAGANGYLIKPFTVDELLAHLDEWAAG